jgi:hypothetical protein
MVRLQAKAILYRALAAMTATAAVGSIFNVVE